MSNSERLYHFTTSKYALDDLSKRRLKIAQFDDLNDPFELKSVNLCDPVNAQAFDGIGELDFEGFKAKVARHFGVLCFSENKADVLQWAHYADRHKGICLAFDVSGSQGKFGKVQYLTERFPFPEREKLDVEFSWKLLSTKSKAWEYEKEWRVFLTLTDGVWDDSAGRVLYFAEFGPELVLNEVILGAANKTEISDVLQAMHGHPATVRVSRMRLSCDKFELQEHPVRG
jgi:Protein of unknown function (DUF2971)